MAKPVTIYGIKNCDSEARPVTWPGKSVQWTDLSDERAEPCEAQ
jgi:hypothetical protein